MAKKSKKPFSLLKQRRLVLVVVAALVLLLGGYWLFWGRHNNNALIPSPTAVTKTGKTASGGYVNLSPPTSSDKQAANDTKNTATQATTPPPTAADGRTQVTPVIASPNNSSTIKFSVSGVTEDGGTCTATATSATTSQQVTGSSTGVMNASNTVCPQIPLNLSSGTWNVVLSYSSTDAVGSSQAQTVTIP